MTTWQAMNALERVGYSFAPTAQGVRATLQGHPPPEASALLEVVRRDREAARAYVLARQEGATVVEDGCTYSLFDALAIGQAIKKGEARLLGKVIFHRQEMTVSVPWEPLTGEASAGLLSRRRECLKNALEARLKAMESSGWGISRRRNTTNSAPNMGVITDCWRDMTIGEVLPDFRGELSE